MHKLIFAMLVTMLSFVSVPASAGDCANTQVCDSFHNPTPANPPVEDMVCIWFNQAHSGNVELILYAYENGPITYQKTRWHPERDKLCFGSWRLQGVSWVVVCNDDAHVTMDSTAIATLLSQKQLDVCSLADGCA